MIDALQKSVLNSSATEVKVTTDLSGEVDLDGFDANIVWSGSHAGNVWREGRKDGKIEDFLRLGLAVKLFQNLERR